MGDVEDLAALRRLADLEAKAGNAPVRLPLSQRVGQSTPEQQRLRDVVSNAVGEGAAAIPDMFLNAPANTINLGNAAIGTGMAAMGRSDLAPNLMQNPDYARRAFQWMGLIKPQQAPQTPGEGYLAAGASGAAGGSVGGFPGMIVGATSNLIGHGVSEVTGSPALGTLTGMAVPMGANAAANYGNNQMRLAAQLRSQNAPAMDTLTEVRNAGYKIPPSQIKPSLINRIAESFGGKAATQQEASIYNEGPSGITAELVRQGLQIPPGTGITEGMLSDLSKQRAQPYRDAAALPGLPAQQIVQNPNTQYPIRYMGPTPQLPSEALKDLNKARIDAKDHWREFQRQGSVAARDAYQSASQRAAQLELDLEKAAVAAGRSDLLPALRNARTEIAKIHDVDRAMNTDRGEVSAIDLAKAKERGVPLSGGLLTAAKMGNAYPKAVQRPEIIGSPGVNNLVAGLSSATGAGIGAITGGWPGATAGAAAGAVGVPIAQMLARKLILSSPYQRLMATPNYDAGVISQGASRMATSPHVQALISYLMARNLNKQE
jgi:hypothetical protein